MPLYSTKFHSCWLEKLDSDGNPVKRWLKQGTDPSTFICSICKTDELSCEMTKIMENVSIIQQKRVRAEHEQLKKKNKLVDEQSKNENDQMF
jgi:hypothetical protein